MSASIMIRLGSIGGGTDFNMSSALSGVSFQLGSSSVSSGPSPRSISSKLYSQFVAGVTVEVTVTKLGAVVMVVRVGDVAGEDVVVNNSDDDEVDEEDVGEEDEEEVKDVEEVDDVIDEHTDDVDDEDDDDDEAVDDVNRSLPVNGSRADCDVKLNTEPQLIGRRSQSSSPP